MIKSKYNDFFKRKITASKVPLSTQFGRSVLSSDDSDNVMNAVRKLVDTGISDVVVLTDENLKNQILKYKK